MSETVVRLRGDGPLPQLGKPDENVVKGIEWLLERAKNGDIHGIAYAITYHNGLDQNHYVGAVSMGTVGHLLHLANEISRNIHKEP